MGERVAMNLIDAAALVREYRTAASQMGSASVQLTPLLAEAAGLLAEPFSASATMLEGTAFELAYDGDDLAWRLDYLQNTDARFAASLSRIGYLPFRRGGPPTWTATELADRFGDLIARASVLDSGELAALLDGLKAYTRRDSDDPEWDEIVEFWREDLPDDDYGLASRIHDVLDELDDLGALRLADLEMLLDELASQMHDPRYLADFFVALGPVDTLGLTEVIGTLGYAEALSSRENGPGFSVDPDDLRNMLSDALGSASQATFSARHHGMVPTLSISWFNELFDAGLTHKNRLFGRDPIRLHDGLPTLFSSGQFRDDVAFRAGELALEVFDHEVDVVRGLASPLYDDFDILETHWEDRGGMLLSAATRYPEVAAALLLHEASSGRTGAQIVADRSFDNMNREVVAGHFADFVKAGTIVAEDLALENGVDARAMRLLRDPWHAKEAIIEAIALQAETETKHDPYPPPLNAAFADVVIHSMPHFMHVPPHEVPGVDVYVDLDGDPDLMTRIPSGHAGISIPPYTAKYLLGALFRNEVDRTRITDAAVLEQRRAYTIDPSYLTLELVGRLEGALANGFIVAGMDDAEAFTREIERSNDRIDAIWDVTEFTVGLIPQGKVVATSAKGIEHLLAVGGIDIQEELLHGESAQVEIEARNDGQRRAFDVDRRAREFVFGRAFDDLRIEYASGGLVSLSDRSRAIFDFMSADSQLRQLIDGSSTHIELPSGGTADLGAEFDSMAWHFTLVDQQLEAEYGVLKRGLSEAHTEHAFD